MGTVFGVLTVVKINLCGAQAICNLQFIRICDPADRTPTSLSERG